MQDQYISYPAAPGKRLWRNPHFNTFWFGQTLSVFGDSFASIAIPLLVLQATGSVALMGLVTAMNSAGQILAGFFAGVIADRVDRRKLMIVCDVVRMCLYGAIPLCWSLFGPQFWLIFLVVGLGSCLGLTFQVAYVTAIPNLVDGDQIVEANSRLQITYSIAFVLGPVLAGFIVGTFGASAAITGDAISFAVSAFSLLFIRLRAVAEVTPLELIKQETVEQVTIPRPIERRSTLWTDFVEGATFIWHNQVLKPMAFLLFILTLLTAGALDLFIFHIKADLGGNDTSVGLVFGLASIGGVVGGVVAPTLRKRLGFGPCWIGSLLLNAVALILIALAPNMVLCCLLAMLFTFSSTVSSVVSMSLRQEITPDSLLGRVTSVFWTVIGVPGPLGAALFTGLSTHVGTTSVLLLIGSLAFVTMLTGLFTPARQRFPVRHF
ncbi:MFS transporter [Dictyobacter arantiisoli]|nr:MFS transporter [Dictyobacter arantiisoli]